MIDEWSGVWTPRTTDGYYYYIYVEMDRYDVYSECYINKYTSPTGGSSNYVGQITTTGHTWNFGTEWQETDPIALEWLLANCRSKGEYKSETSDTDTETSDTDTKPVYLRKNGAWVKQIAYERQPILDFPSFTSNSVQTTGTSLTCEVGCTVGDLVVAAIITRDTLNVSDGWNLLSTSEVNSTDTTNQRLSFAYKVATSTTESITVTQASSQRLYITLVAIKGATVVINNGYSYVNEATKTITVTKPSGLTLWGCSAPLWDSAAPYEQWGASNDAILIDLGTEVQSRLGVFIDRSKDEEVTFISKFNSTLIVGSLTIQGGESYTQGWVQISSTIDTNFLTFSSPSTFTLGVVDNTKHWDGTLEYSTDASTWNIWDGTTTLSANNGKLYLRGTRNTKITTYSGRWALNGSNISCEGNIENLLDYTIVSKGAHPMMGESCFKYMFYNCTNLISAPELPALTLTPDCYYNLFFGCTGLTRAPALPATSLATRCYFGMFERCTGLTSIPILPATVLPDECYRYMFQYCTQIKLSAVQTNEYKTAYRIPEIGNGTAGTDALTNMFNGCGGTFNGTPSINQTYYTSNTVV